MSNYSIGQIRKWVSAREDWGVWSKQKASKRALEIIEQLLAERKAILKTAYFCVKKDEDE